MASITKNKSGPGPGAGFIIVKTGKSKKILALINHDGTYDLPKGTLDKKDASFLDCAKRECYEECSIKVFDHNIYKSIPPISSGKLIVFTAQTKQKPKIIKNVDSGILEHIGFKWVTTSQFKKKTSEYLANAISQFENYMFLI